MRILIADDDAVGRLFLQATLRKWGHEVLATGNGEEAIAQLDKPGAPGLWILDWNMPGLSGLDVCRKVRERPDPLQRYLILLTGNNRKEDVIEGMNAGANDYVVKPFEQEELKVRINAGVRIVELQQELLARLKELEASLENNRQLKGLIPICSFCKKVRDDKNYWTQVETYIGEHADVRFSHGLCPDCRAKHYPGYEGENAAP